MERIGKAETPAEAQLPPPAEPLRVPLVVSDEDIERKFDGIIFTRQSLKKDPLTGAWSFVRGDQEWPCTEGCIYGALGSAKVRDYHELRAGLRLAYEKPDETLTEYGSFERVYATVHALHTMRRQLVGSKIRGLFHVYANDIPALSQDAPLDGSMKVYRRLLGIFAGNPDLEKIDQIITLEWRNRSTLGPVLGGSLRKAARRHGLERSLLLALDRDFDKEDTVAQLEEYITHKIGGDFVETDTLKLERSLLDTLRLPYPHLHPRLQLVSEYLSSTPVPIPARNTKQNKREERISQYNHAMFGVLLQGLLGNAGNQMKMYLQQHDALRGKSTPTKDIEFNPRMIIDLGIAAQKSLAAEGLETKYDDGLSINDKTGIYRAMEIILAAVEVSLGNNDASEAELQHVAHAKKCIKLLEARVRSVVAATAGVQAVSRQVIAGDSFVPGLPAGASKERPFKPGSGAIS